MSQESVSAVSQTERHVSNWNLPNILTVVRIIAVPFFVVVLLAGGTFGAEDVAQRWLAFALFIAAMITDWADGYLARSRNLITSFGKIADPIADKLLTGAAFITLSWLGELWWWVTAVILLREWGITIMRFFVIKYGRKDQNRFTNRCSRGDAFTLRTPRHTLVGSRMGSYGGGNCYYRLDRGGLCA